MRRMHEVNWVHVEERTFSSEYREHLLEKVNLKNSGDTMLAAIAIVAGSFDPLNQSWWDRILLFV